MNIPFVNTVATGQNIDRLRIAAGLSVKDMQMVFGFATPQAIYKWLHGAALPTIDNLVILAALLEVTIDDIVVYERYCDSHPDFRNGRTTEASQFIREEYGRLFKEHKL